MNASAHRSNRLALAIAVAALASALCLPLALSPAARASSLRPLADSAPSLPVSTTFEKASDSETGPYVLKIQNTSKDSLKVSGQVQPSVTFHANAKVRDLAEHVLDPGQVWTISELAAGDKVTLKADGYSPLELTVP